MNIMKIIIIIFEFGAVKAQCLERSSDVLLRLKFWTVDGKKST